MALSMSNKEHRICLCLINRHNYQLPRYQLDVFLNITDRHTDIVFYLCRLEAEILFRFQQCTKLYQESSCRDLSNSKMPQLTMRAIRYRWAKPYHRRSSL